MGDRVKKVQPVIDRTFTECMEQLQEGYVSAIAATAGCTVEFRRRDLYGVDMEVTRSGKTDADPETSIYLQLKSTTTIKPNSEAENFSYQFKKREYFEKLAIPNRYPKAFLVVMATSPIQQDWTKGGHEALEMLHCCYWVNLEGKTIKPGVQAPTVHIPTANVFDANGLSEMLDRIEHDKAAA
ncbi:DUF4365 domain-containing protein [Amycolatopsis sp. YIM 10]|uniref:DUF4365 domain-containing protein n=1 Tax=Amycolatopsis sp. YIM 10 TaxID=2653857 RepID=UPI0012A9C935|nr:DUF4365 domain-containing protein [Amycolatopsis sp. YIM 10]QFU94070.1 hypothetical protein YIM_44695 [Amycolatopsis sp. YIM 10]